MYIPLKMNLNSFFAEHYFPFERLLEISLVTLSPSLDWLVVVKQHPAHNIYKLVKHFCGMENILLKYSLL